MSNRVSRAIKDFDDNSLKNIEVFGLKAERALAGNMSPQREKSTKMPPTIKAHSTITYP